MEYQNQQPVDARSEIIEPEKGSYRPGWAEVIGPHYSVEISGKDYNLLGFLNRSWADGWIPILFGRKQIGKTHILKPYLEVSFPGVVVEEVSYGNLKRLQVIPDKMVVFSSLHGKEEGGYQVQVDNQIRNVCESNQLFKESMFRVGIVKLEVTDENVDEMMGFFGVHNSKRWHRRKIVKAFSNDEFKPIRSGITAIKNHLGDKLPIDMR